jgi:putative intracellular protease/amidase
MVKTINAVRTEPKKILMVVANPSIATTTKFSVGTHMIQGKTITGFSNVEEDFVDNLMQQKVMPFRIEDEDRKIGANFVSAGLWKEFAIRDGRLITGQQQYSGKATARFVIESLGLA